MVCSLPRLSQHLRISESASPGTGQRQAGDYQVLTPQKSLEAQPLTSKLALPRPSGHTAALGSPATRTICRQPPSCPQPEEPHSAHPPLLGASWERQPNLHLCLGPCVPRAFRTEVVQRSGHDVMRWGQPRPSACEEASFPKVSVTCHAAWLNCHQASPLGCPGAPCTSPPPPPSPRCAHTSCLPALTMATLLLATPVHAQPQLSPWHLLPQLLPTSFSLCSCLPPHKPSVNKSSSTQAPVMAPPRWESNSGSTSLFRLHHDLLPVHLTLGSGTCF